MTPWQRRMPGTSIAQLLEDERVVSAFAIAASRNMATTDLGFRQFSGLHVEWIDGT
jgi:hypothetical protein